MQDYVSIAIGIDVEHDEALKAILLWISHDANCRLKHLDSLLEQIQLAQCCLEFLVATLDTYGASLSTNSSALKQLARTMTKITVPPNAKKQSPKLKAKIKKMLLIVGGQVGEKVNHKCWKLNLSNQLEEFCEIPFDDLAKRHSVYSTPQGFILTGGEGSKMCLAYYASTKCWRKLKDMLIERYRHGSVYIAGVLYVLGGSQSGEQSKSVDRLVLDEQNWESGPNLPIATFWPKVLDIDGTIYLLHCHHNSIDTVFLKMNAINNGWIQKTSPPRGTNSFVSMTSVHGRLCVIGGNEKICAWYTPATDTWVLSRPPPLKHQYGAAVLYGDRVLLLGGAYGQNGTVRTEELHVENERWEDSNITLSANLWNHHAVLLNIRHK